MLALGTNPRRLLLGNLSAAGIALAGNFLGVTSKLLTAVPEEVVEKTSLDAYYPRVSHMISYQSTVRTDIEDVENYYTSWYFLLVSFPFPLLSLL
jgi:hypothetical protein